MAPLTIATLGDLDGAYQLHGVCCACRSMRQLDLATLLGRLGSAFRIGLCSAFENGALGHETVTMKDATFAKLFCDAFFLHYVRVNELEKRGRKSP